MNTTLKAQRNPTSNVGYSKYNKKSASINLNADLFFKSN